MNKVILITGANGGIGKETARQLALKNETEKIYLACRNETKAQAAKVDLETKTGCSIFEIVIMDVSNPTSVKRAVSNISEPLDALIMNAGGMGGKTPEKVTTDGVTQIFATNVLGHVALVEELLKANKLKNVALYAGSEAARGVKKMNMKQPNLKTSSVEEFSSIIDGSYFNGEMDEMEAYGLVKYIAALWMSSQAIKNPDIRFITMSPGGTKGTSVMDDLTGIQKFMFKYVMMPIVMPMMGMAHSLETGAKRFVDGISNKSFKSGVFYGSKKNVITGPIVDQSEFFSDLNNAAFQDNAAKAIYMFIN